MLFLAGGSSRGEVQSLSILNPAMIICCAAAIGHSGASTGHGGGGLQLASGYFSPGPPICRGLARASGGLSSRTKQCSGCSYHRKCIPFTVNINCGASIRLAAWTRRLASNLAVSNHRGGHFRDGRLPSTGGGDVNGPLYFSTRLIMAAPWVSSPTETMPPCSRPASFRCWRFLP